MVRRTTGPRIAKRTWGRVRSIGTALGAGATLGVDLTGPLIADEVEEATVLTVKGKIYLEGTSQSYCDFGVLLLDEDAVAFPQLLVDVDMDYMLLTVLAAYPSTDTQVPHLIDIRSMRRMRERDRTLWMVFQNNDVTSMSVVYHIETLIGAR